MNTARFLKTAVVALSLMPLVSCAEKAGQTAYSSSASGYASVKMEANELCILLVKNLLTFHEKIKNEYVVRSMVDSTSNINISTLSDTKYKISYTFLQLDTHDPIWEIECTIDDNGPGQSRLKTIMSCYNPFAFTNSQELDLYESWRTLTREDLEGFIIP